MDFTSCSKHASEKINQTIKDVFAEWKLQEIIPNPELKKLIDPYEERVTGGKCLRGILVLLGYEISGAEPNTELLKIATAYELLHTSILILDDVIDKSPM